MLAFKEQWTTPKITWKNLQTWRKMDTWHLPYQCKNLILSDHYASTQQFLLNQEICRPLLEVHLNDSNHKYGGLSLLPQSIEGVYLQKRVQAWTMCFCSVLPVSASQTFVVKSAEPGAMCKAFVSKQTLYTTPLCPSKLRPREAGNHLKVITYLK